MKIVAWIKSLWNKAIAVFGNFIDVAFPIASKLIIAELRDFAIYTVSHLEVSDLKKEEKRKQALNELAQEAKVRGIDLSTSLANCLIEIALQFCRKKAER